MAKVLYDDFNRLPAAEAGFGPDQCGLDGAREKTADDVRVEGNDLWKQGNIQGAIDSYTRAIGMCSQGESDTASLLNRAMARLKLAPPGDAWHADSLSAIVAQHQASLIAECTEP